jgi:hypothetical protein
MPDKTYTVKLNGTLTDDINETIMADLNMGWYDMNYEVATNFVTGLNIAIAKYLAACGEAGIALKSSPKKK